MGGPPPRWPALTATRLLKGHVQFVGTSARAGVGANSWGNRKTKPCTINHIAGLLFHRIIILSSTDYRSCATPLVKWTFFPQRFFSRQKGLGRTPPQFTFVCGLWALLSPQLPNNSEFPSHLPTRRAASPPSCDGDTPLVSLVLINGRHVRERKGKLESPSDELSPPTIRVV